MDLYRTSSGSHLPMASAVSKVLFMVLAAPAALMVSSVAAADTAPLPTQIVDLANKVDGVHPGYRAFHAKGMLVEGTFKASSDAARLSRATLFNGSSIRVTARFSDGSGMPTVPDGSPAMPRGIAIKYHLPGGADTDMVTNSFKFFPVGTGEDFRDLLQAIVASPPDAPHPSKIEQFFGTHPNASKANGSLPRFLQLCTRLSSVAAVCPPRSLPRCNQFLRPRAIGRIAFSVALLSMERYADSRYRESAAQFDRA